MRHHTPGHAGILILAETVFNLYALAYAEYKLSRFCPCGKNVISWGSPQHVGCIASDVGAKYAMSDVLSET